MLIKEKGSVDNEELKQVNPQEIMDSFHKNFSFYSSEHEEKKLNPKNLEGFKKQFGSQLQSNVISVIDKLFKTYMELSGSQKLLVVAALTYLITPLDLIPDITPIGLTDDLIILKACWGSVKDTVNSILANNSSNQTEKDYTTDDKVPSIKQSTLDWDVKKGE